jgi:hypothetical protein
MAYLQITAAQTDAESPLNQALFDQIRENFDYVTDGTKINANLVATASIQNVAVTEAKIGTGAVVEAKLRAGSVTEAKLGASAVAAGKLKATTNTVSTTTAANLYPTNSGYSFYPRFYDVVSTGAPTCYAYMMYALAASTLGSSAKLVIHLNDDGNGAGTLYAEFTYVQASPPHAFADSDDWGLFVFLLRDSSTGQVLSSSVAEDPVWDGDWSPLPKGHPARIAEMPHPFADYYPYTDKRPEAEGLEIVLVDLREQNQPVRRDKKAHVKAFMARERQKYIAMGISAQELDAAEAAVVDSVEEEVMPTWRAVEADAKAQGKTLPMLVTSREWAPIQATKEISDAHKLPSCERFRSVVKVLTA